MSYYEEDVVTNCPSCGRPQTYHVLTTDVFGGEDLPPQRTGPSCWMADCGGDRP